MKEIFEKNKMKFGIVAAALVLAAVIVAIACTAGNKGVADTADSSQSTVQTDTHASDDVEAKATDPAEGDTKDSEDIKTADKSKADSKENKNAGATASDTATATEIPQITPIFMYFVSKSDSNYDKYMKVIDELKKEYDGRVEFDIRDIDKNPENKENFGMVDGNTPVLIMNNHDNNITAIEFKCADKAKLVEDIEASFE